MPAGIPVSDYDILCPAPGQMSASRALRPFTVPVNATILTDQQPGGPGQRGIAMRGPVVMMPDGKWYSGPNPITGKVHRSKCDGPNVVCMDDYSGMELGLCSSVLSLYVMGLNDISGLGTPAPIIFQIRQGAGGTTTVRFTGIFIANTFGYRDLLVQVKGLLGTQWEIWARVAPGAGAGTMEFRLAACLDIHDDKVSGTIAGPNVVPGGP